MNAQLSTPNRRPLPGPYSTLAPQQIVRSDKGIFYLYSVRPGVLFCECVGHIDAKLAEGLREFGNRMMDRDGPTTFFHDWDACTGYDSSARAELTAWSIERRTTVRRVVVLTRSKLVSMGVATANLATSVVGVHMHGHTSREAFEKEFLSVQAPR